MLVVFVGSDTVGVRSRAHTFFDKESDGAFERITVESYVPGMITEYAGSVSLFEAPAPVLLDFLFELDDAREAIEEALPLLKESSRTFVLIDEKPLAATARELKQYAERYEELAGGEKAERFNTFMLADALLKRDKKLLWVLLHRAIAAGEGPEAIVGVLQWQLKTARTALCSKTLEESGLKEFPYKKGKSAAKAYSLVELERASEELIRLYHEGHAGRDMALGLERFVLSL